MYGKWKTMIKVGENREREEKSDTENTMKP